MSIVIGVIAFSVASPFVLVLGGILMGRLSLLDSKGLIPTGFAVLFLVGIVVGLAVDILAGTKYYRYIEKWK